MSRSLDETFYHIPGRAVQNGGAGHDTYIFRNTSARYNWVAEDHGIKFTHKVSNKSVLLLNIETIKFRDDGRELTFVCSQDNEDFGNGSEIHLSQMSWALNGLM